MPLWVNPDIPLTCINQAAQEYHVPAKLILAVLNVERGKVGQTVKNKNGSYDLGPMQINSSWSLFLLHHGITLDQVKNDACTNIRVGTWILSKNIADGNDLFQSIGSYNSHTARFNMRYTQQVRIKYTELNQLLEFSFRR